MARWDTWVDLWESTITGGDATGVEQFATQLRHALGGDPHTICRDLGVEVVERPLRGRVGGIIDRHSSRVILVDHLLEPAEQRRVVAHELAHLFCGVLHRRGQAVPRAHEERLCDQFAALVIECRDEAHAA